MICASIYCGPKYNFGNGSRIWIDNLDQAHGTLQYFKAYLEDPSIKKVFHNYSFDYHELRNEGITVQGFSCDTMHMARLWESSRVGKGSYSLESLSEELYIRKRPYKEIFGKPHIKRDGMQGKTIDVPPVIVAFLPFFLTPRTSSAAQTLAPHGSITPHSTPKPRGTCAKSSNPFSAKCFGPPKRATTRSPSSPCGISIVATTATSVSCSSTWSSAAST